MAVSTALDLIKGALTKLRVYSDDSPLTASEANGALDTLNLMLESWSIDSLLVYYVVKESFALIAGKNPYTIGIGGDLSTDRPIDIEGATITINGVDYPIKKMAFDDYAAVKLKALPNSFPDYYYLDQTYPLSTLYLYPVPNLVISTLTIYSRKLLQQFANLTDVVVLPPAYKRSLIYNLAIELAMEYQAMAGKEIIGIATGSKAALMRVNKRPITMTTDLTMLNSRRPSFNIYRGT